MVLIASSFTLMLYVVLRWLKFIKAPLNKMAICRTFLDGGAAYTFGAIILAYHITSMSLAEVLTTHQLGELFYVAVVTAAIETGWGVMTILELVDRPSPANKSDTATAGV